MLQCGEVHTNLMRPSRVELTAQESMPAAPFDHLVARERETPAADHRHPFPLLRIRAYRPRGRSVSVSEMLRGLPSLRATPINPDVPLSSRWTIPGRIEPPATDQLPP